MKSKKLKWTYSGHHFNGEAKGHIFLGHDKKGASVIELTGAASMTQDELNKLGELIVAKVNQ